MIALAMILKDTEPFEIVRRCLLSSAPHVDAIYLTINGKVAKETDSAKELKSQIEELAKERKFPEVVFSYTKWEMDFAKARNFNFDQVPPSYDFILWLDADDVLRGGENLKQVEAEALEKGFGAIFFNYLYRVELENGNIKNVLIEHLRERLIRNDGSYRWISPIHETLIEQRQTNKTDSGLCDVVHLSTDERAESAMDRNIAILEKQLEEQGNRKDPRTLYYLGKAYFDKRTPEHWDKAQDLITKYIYGSETNTPSGWAEERAQAHEYLAEIARDRGQYEEAIKHLQGALKEDPKFPNFYIDMAMVYMFMQDWAKARHWALLGQKVPYPKTTLVSNPKDMQVRTMEVLFNVAVNTNDLEGAWALAHKIAEMFPGDKTVQERARILDETKVNNEVAHQLIGVARYLSTTGQGSKVTELVKAIPKQIEEEPVMVSLRRDFTPPRVWQEDEITILCGKGFEKWSPKSLDQGIGGSEEAVIYLSKELSNLGWRVTVYADPQDDAGVYDGVVYEPHYKFNPNDEFNILVGWRNVGMFDQNWKAKKTYLWLHDIQNPNEYTPYRVDRITKIFALSKWHRDNMPNVPDEKFMITGNGIYLPHFYEIDKKKIKRNPHRCFYGSSYDRGLEHLLKIWPDVIKEVPDAELHIFYGWKLFDQFYSNNPERMAWKKKMEGMMDQKGITHHGRVGQKEVLEEAYKSGIWAYPTHFGEISCINAMKNQAAGAIPVVCDYAALKETTKFGMKIDVGKEDIYDPDKLKEYKDSLVSALKNEKWQEDIRPDMMEWARKKFSWGAVAEQWGKEFKSDPLREAAEVILEKDKKLSKYLPVELQERMGHEQTY